MASIPQEPLLPSQLEKHLIKSEMTYHFSSVARLSVIEVHESSAFNL